MIAFAGIASYCEQSLMSSSEANTSKVFRAEIKHYSRPNLRIAINKAKQTLKANIWNWLEVPSLCPDNKGSSAVRIRISGREDKQYVCIDSEELPSSIRL